MISFISNLSLDTRAAINSLTRPSRKRRATRQNWHEETPNISFSGSYLLDALCAFLFGVMTALTFGGLS